MEIFTFGAASGPLAKWPASTQAKYLRRYLSELGAAHVLVENEYFDRDFLSEFVAYYGSSAKGYSNRCKRLHFFTSCALDRRKLRLAVGGSPRVRKALQDAYLGFVVIRPLPGAPFGRTVLKWYPNGGGGRPPRVLESTRSYECHVAGMPLSVDGLAWQQQDTGVGACATIALWSMLHSSAYDDHHAIPTTADITRSANRTAALGSRVFPSLGLRVEQLCEAVKENSLAPILAQGTAALNGRPAFGRDQFAINAASLLRSGYPVLIMGALFNRATHQLVGFHAVCAVGFRDSAMQSPAPGSLVVQDSSVQYYYIHDDNIGPSVRFETAQFGAGGQQVLALVPSTPPPQDPNNPLPDNTADYPYLVPERILAAVHNDVRVSPETLSKSSLKYVNGLLGGLQSALLAQGQAGFGFSIGWHLMKVSQYLDTGLGNVLGGDAKALARVRLELVEFVSPMSLHVGVARVWAAGVPAFDLVMDTTDSHKLPPVFCLVAYSPFVASVAAQIGDPLLGRVVAAR